MVDNTLLLVTAAIVQFMKEFGVTGKYSIVASLLIGGGLAAFKQYVPEFYNEFLPILITGLVASGLYDLVRSGGTALRGMVNGRCNP